MSIFRKKAIEKVVEPDIQIMMLGGRRVGKTSMLASMYNSFDNVTAGTNLQISKRGGKAIDESLDHMTSLFKIPHMVNEKVPGVSDFMQTQGFDKIDFMLSIAGKRTVRPKVVRFVDCSGEWLNNREKEDEIGEQIEKSEVIMIAIDSVLLMEEGGRYCHQNAIRSVTECIIRNMNPDDMLNSKKMVLFVPMKCEKYYHQNEDENSFFYHKRIQNLIDRIQEEYKQLLNFLTKPNNKKYFTVGILPVITLGGVEFDEFTADNKDNILTDEIEYTYCEPDRFEPKFCDRPLIYSLLFTQKKIADDYYKKAYNDRNKGKKKISATLKEWIQDRKNYAKDVDFIYELEQIKENISAVEYPGFTMLQDPEFLELGKENVKKG